MFAKEIDNKKVSGEKKKKKKKKKRKMNLQ
jgi:hypothetical protein